MLKRHRLIATFLAHLVLGCAVGAAQDVEAVAAGPATGKEASVPPPPAQLDKVWLTDVNGVLVPEGGSIAEYHRALDVAKGVASESGKPKVDILSLVATGQAKSDRVDLSVKLKIAIETEREDWVSIPLRFGQAALRKPPSDADAGHQRVVLQAPENGDSTVVGRSDYVLWLRGRGEGTIEEVALEFAVPLSGIGRERRLVLSVPNAAASELRLTVPMVDAEADVSGGAILDPPEANGDHATDLVVRGFRGEIDLTWRRRNGNATDVAPVLTSRGGVITATVASHNVEFKAVLNINVAGHALSRFEVRLPPGAVLSETKDSDYAVRDVTPPDQPSGEGRLVEVAFSKPVSNSEVVVTLRAKSDAPAENGQYPLAGFEVSNAIDQRGLIVVCVPGEWDVHCDPGRDVEQVSEIPAGQTPEEVLATFRYFEQPFTLAARVFPKQERISVESRYDLSIESDMARLASSLKYAVRGNKAYQLKIDLNGWEFDRVGPEQLVKACEVDESGLLVIALDKGMMSEFELSLSAHKPIDPAEPSLVLPLPKPHATYLSSTALIVLPADNIELREDLGRTIGLERQKVSPPASLELPEIQQEPLYYRGETDEMGEAAFAATMSVREQEIVAELSTEIHIKATRASVQEDMIYDVKYEPTSSLTIQVPAELAVKYFLDGEAVAAVATEESAVGDKRVSRKIVLPSPRQGRLKLTAEYMVPVPELEPLASSRCLVPLIVPQNVAWTGHRLRVTVDAGIAIGDCGSQWQKVRGNQASYADGTVVEFTAETPETDIVILVHENDPDTYGSAVVHSAWIQTWMTDDERQDRAVYRFVSDFVSDRSYLVIFLPSGADTDRLRVLLDGKKAELVDGKKEESSTSEKTVRVELQPEQTPRPHVLELSYYTKTRPPRGSMQLELPRLADNIRVRRCYWQLVLPGNEHVVSVPRDYTAEYEWSWQGAWWGRVPVKKQADLEKWVGAIPEDPVPEAMSCYLFSKFGPPKTAELVTAGRTSIVGGVSGLALLFGLLLIYFPALRHPVFGLILVVAIMASAIVWPGASLLCAQAAGFGLAFSLLGAILYRGMARRRRHTTRRDLPSSVLERGSTQAQFGSSEVDLLRSTSTDPDAAAVHAPEH